MYYGSSRTSIQEEIESGVDVVVTSYGTLVSDFKKSGGGTLADATKKGKAKEAQSKPKPKTKQGLYSGASILSFCEFAWSDPIALS